MRFLAVIDHLLPLARQNIMKAPEIIAAETSEEAAAIIDATEIVVGGMKTSNPWFFHTKAILTPKHLRALDI